MDPVISYSGLELSLVELILAFAVLLLGVLFGIALTRHSARRAQGKMTEMLNLMSDRQNELQGRLSQFTEAAERREEKLRTNLDTRLDQVSHKVGQSLSETQERSAKNLKDLHERLALIDRAQKNIETLAGEVSSLQAVLSNKQARGAFGEKQMQDLIANFLPPNAYSFQAVLSNKTRVDALIHLPGDQGDVPVDAKFPMESWKRLSESTGKAEQRVAAMDFRRDVSIHVKAIADKYLIFGETYDVALMFLPSEAIYAELHTHFADIVDKSFKQRVMIVSPTTFMATLHTMRAVMKDAKMREQAHILQKEIGILAEDVRRLSERTNKLQTHFN
ncbi:MAG TPA: DNA recombination protein RmuC, partial [Hellea balneolensis]|nr:DNA recombination protein RmuC [Hellea balneolensis]